MRITIAILQHTHKNVQTNSTMCDVTFDVEIMAAIMFNTKITDTCEYVCCNIPIAIYILMHGKANWCVYVYAHGCGCIC